MPEQAVHIPGAGRVASPFRRLVDDGVSGLGQGEQAQAEVNRMGVFGCGRGQQIAVYRLHSDPAGFRVPVDFGVDKDIGSPG